MRRVPFYSTLLFVLVLAGSIGVFVLTVQKGVLVALGFVLLFAAILGAIWREEVAIYSFIMVTLLEGLYKAIAPNMLTMLLKDIFLAILWLRLLLRSQRQKDFRWLQQPFTLAAICFTLYCIAEMFAPTTRSFLLALAGLRAWLLWMPAFFPFYAYFHSTERLLRFVLFLTVLMFPVSVYGIIQANIGYQHLQVIPGFYRIVKWYQLTGYAYEAEGILWSRPIMSIRATSIHIAPATFGAMSAVLVLLSLGYATYTASLRLRLGMILSGLAAAGGLLASGSRAPMLGLLIGLGAMLLVVRRRSALFVAAGLMGLTTGYVLHDLALGGAWRIRTLLRLERVWARVWQPLQIGLEQGLRHPLGVGIATEVGAGRLFQGARLPQPSIRWVENEFGRALSELGFPGLFLWLWLIVGILWHCGKAVRRMGDSPESLLAAGMLAGMISVFVQLSVGSALYNAHAGLYYWIWAAAILRLYEFGEEARARAKAGPGADKKAEDPQSAAITEEALQRADEESRQPSPFVSKPPQPGPYRRAPGAPPGPRPGAPPPSEIMNASSVEEA